MTDHLKTTPRTFHQLWERVQNQGEAEATATLATIGHRTAGALDDTTDLPRVDHLMAMGEVLGFGGNGEVVAAEQAALRRTIAVKRPRDGASMRERLLREAWVIGYLEHPNIPPVHFVGSNAAEQLLVGLKRIEGETLTERLSRERGLDNLDENLGIFIQVCNAIGFAHARGVLHLDVKPDNVMTGHFGEVYLLDWGLAMAFGEQAVPELVDEPGPASVRGTPAFLAPEMITGERLDAATDVYLLGGLLHYMVTRKPPNAGDTALDAMQSAYDPPPRVFGAEVPERLGEIIRRALAPEPADRFASADELRTAVTEYRRDRHELEAIATARIQLGRVARVVADDRADPAVVYQAYGAARQAIEEAARVGSSGKSRALLQRVLEQLIDWELGRGNLGGAELLLSELPRPNEELSARCAELRADGKTVAAELRALRWEIDPDVGSLQKAAIVAGVGATIGALEVVPYLLDIPGTPQRVLIGYFIYLVVLTVMTFLARRLLLRTRVNRALMSAIWLLSLYGLVMRFGAYGGLLALNHALGFDLVMVCLMTAYVAVNLDRRIIVALPIYAIGCAICLTSSSIALVAFAMTHAIAMALVAIAISYRSTSETE